MAQQPQRNANRNTGRGSPPRRPAQGQRQRTQSGNRPPQRRTTGGQGQRRVSTQRRPSRPPARRRSYRRPIYTKLSFWITVCTLIIVIVLLFKGCESGKLTEGDAPVSAATGSSAQTTDPTAPPTSAGGAAPSTAPTAAPTSALNPTSPTSASTPTAPTVAPTDAPTQPQSTVATQPPTRPKDDNAGVTTQYRTYGITAGTYRVGIEIPVGTADLVATGGVGSLAASDGSIAYPVFGGENTAQITGAVFTRGMSLTVTGDLTVKLTYTTEPTIDQVQPPNKYKVYTLAGGTGSTFTVGVDLDAGLYNVAAVAGYGEVVTSDAATGTGMNEMMGMGANYQQTVKNVTLNEGVVITVRDCTVRFSMVVPEEE